MRPFHFPPPSYGCFRPQNKRRCRRSSRFVRKLFESGFNPVSPIPAYIIAARRSALGRIGGLHKQRRIEELTAPVVAAALQDSKLEATRIDSVLVGNATQGGNPARLIALAAGLPESVAASTIDRQCGS